MRRIYFQVLHVIGHYCHKLVELHVSHCTDVTDQGLEKLLLDASGSVQCPSLTKLYVEATRVTEESVKVLFVTARVRSTTGR